MQAIVIRQFGGPEVLKLETAPDPQAAAGHLLVRVRAVGVNPVDTYIRSGTYAVRPPLPYIPGGDGAGTLEAVGADVRGFAPGDRVYFYGTSAGRGMGACASLAACEPSQVHPLPHGASFQQGAAIGVPYATAYRALFGRAGARPGDVLLVHGASGGVGVAAVQMASAHGLTVVGTAGTDEGLELVRAQGARHVVNHHKDGYADALMAATDGRGYDVILEMLANVNLDRDLTLLAQHGRVVVIGNRGRIEIDPRQAMRRDAAILGMVLWNADERELASIHAALVAGLARGMLNPVVGRELPLAEAARAHELVMAPGARGKIVLIP